MKRLTILLLLAGCASPQASRDAEITAGWQRINETCNRVFAARSLDPIRMKLASLQGLSQPTLQMLSDSTFATDEQRPAIIALDAAAIECVNPRIQHAAKYFGSDYAAVENARLSDSQQLRVELYQGKITWGQYVSRGKELSDQARGMMAELDRRHQQIGIQQQAANAQSAGAAAAVMRATQIQPIQPMVVPAPPRSINCTSIQQGAFTNTNCR
jgi:hypothetical protein